MEGYTENIGVLLKRELGIDSITTIDRNAENARNYNLDVVGITDYIENKCGWRRNVIYYDAEIINHCIKHGQLYEDAAHHNCVFVGYEHGTPAYGALRGTLSETTFAGEVPGSEKRFSFAVPLRAGGKTICVFESAIDALSYLTLLKLRGQDWRTANTLSLSGIYQPRKDGSIRFPAALEQYLTDNPGVTRIVLCLDNDEPGRAASAAIQKRLSEYEVIDNPPRCGKDYNDQLRLVKGISGRVRTRGGEAR